MPINVGIVQINVTGTVPTTGSGAKNIFNIFFYRCSPFTLVSAIALANSFLTNVWALVAASLSSQYTGVATFCRFLDDATTQFGVANVPASGAVTGARLPTTSSVVFPLRAQQRGKNYRGSKHFGPIAEAHVTNDELNATGLPLWQAVTPALSQVLTVTGATCTPCVLSRNLSTLGPRNPTLLQTSDITAALLNKTIGVMRKRKEKTVR